VQESAQAAEESGRTTLEPMVNAEIRHLHDPDGTAVCNAAFDLSAEQLAAAGRACNDVRIERHRGETLDTDATLALRELTGVCDELHRLEEAGGHATVVLPLARLVALHDALHDWVADRTERGWLREDEETALPIVAAMLDPMGDLRAEALRATLGTSADRAESPGA
jgi:hypothetical protein